MKTITKFLALVLLVFTLVTACSKDEEVNSGPAYVGTWSNTGTFSGMPSVNTLVLSTSVFDFKIALAYLPTVTAGEVIGTFEVSGSNFNMTISKIGIRNTQTFEMVYYNPDSPEFVDYLDQILQFTSGEYSVLNNQLSLKNDLDNDETYSADEIQVFTKK